MKQHVSYIYDNTYIRKNMFLSINDSKVYQKFVKKLSPIVKKVQKSKYEYV